MPLITLLWLQSGVFKFIEDIGPHNGRLFLVVCNLAVFVAAVPRNLIRGRLMPHRPHFWTAYILGFLFISASITAVTAFYEPKSVYQILRNYSGYLTFLASCYMTLTFVPSPGRLLRNIERIVIVLFGLDIASYLSGKQLFASGFGNAPDAFSLDAYVNGAVRFSPFGIWAAVFCAFYAAYLLLAKTKQNMPAPSSLRLEIILIASLGTIAFTFTRSLIMSSGLLLLYLVAINFKCQQKWIGIVVLLGTLGVLATLLSPFLTNALMLRTTRGFQAGFVDQWRMLELHQARQVFAANPILGIGLGSPYSEVMSGLAGGAEAGYAVNANFDIHNMYASVAINYGITGLVLLGVGVLTFLTLPLPSTNPERAFVVGAKLLLVCSLLAGLYAGPFFNSVDCFYQAVIFCYATVLSAQGRAMDRVTAAYEDASDIGSYRVS